MGDKERGVWHPPTMPDQPPAAALDESSDGATVAPPRQEPTPVYFAANAFGFKAVVWLQDRQEYRLLHGNVEHGRQSRDPGKARLPLGYFHRAGPLGDALQALGQPGEWAVVGLGVGAAAAYCAPGQKLVFFEIDPDVATIANTHFTYLRDCAGPWELRMGDGLASLAAAENQQFSVILIDAYDASEVPAHFLSAYAFATYLARLAPTGTLVMAATHGRDAVLPLVVQRAAELKLAVLTRLEVVSATEDRDGDRQTSRYVAVARRAEHLAALAQRPGWMVPPIGTSPEN